MKATLDTKMMRSMNNILITVLLCFLFTVVISGRSTDQCAKKHDIRQLTCQAPPRDALTGDLLEPNKPIYRDSFAPVETVWIAFCSNIFQSKIFEKNNIKKKDRKVRVYVIQDGAVNWDNNPNLINLSYKDYYFSKIPPNNQNENMIYIPVWKTSKINRNRTERYDVVIDLPPYGEYNIGFDIVDGKDQEGFSVPSEWLCLESILFNHTPESSYYDAIDIRKNWEFDIFPQEPEWNANGNSFPATFIKRKSITIKAILTSSLDLDISEIIVLARRHSGKLGDLGRCRYLNHIDNCQENEFYKSWTVDFQVLNFTPDEVSTFYQEWEWYYKLPNSDTKHYFGNSRNKIYIILTHPQAPWKRGGVSKPWIDVLDLACTWANGENTPEGTASKIAYNLNQNIGGCWVSESRYVEDCCNGGFFLQNFLDSIPKTKGVNCHDIGKAMITFANVVGCDLNYRYCNFFGDLLNCIKPIGSKEFICFERYKNHAFCSKGNKIFDATFYHVNIENNPNKNPHHTHIMSNISWEDYIQNIVKRGYVSYPRTYHFDIIYGSKTPNPLLQKGK